MFWIDAVSNLGYKLLNSGVHEQYMVNTLESHLKPGDTFVDLAANEGYFSVIASKIVGEKGTVLAIEPQERLQNIIQKNIELNKCKNIKISKTAISDKFGKAYIHLTSDMNSGASSLLRPTRYPLPRQQVDTATLSSVFRSMGIDKCKLLKIDIEGWEYEAIMGSLDLFKDHRIEIIALELHPKALNKRGHSGQEITNKLKDLNYFIDDTFGNTVFVAKSGSATS